MQPWQKIFLDKTARSLPMRSKPSFMVLHQVFGIGLNTFPKEDDVLIALLNSGSVECVVVYDRRSNHLIKPYNYFCIYLFSSGPYVTSDVFKDDLFLPHKEHGQGSTVVSIDEHNEEPGTSGGYHEAKCSLVIRDSK